MNNCRFCQLQEKKRASDCNPMKQFPGPQPHYITNVTYMKTIILSCLAPLMERLNSHYSFLLFSAAVGAAGVVSLALCLAAEFKKAKVYILITS